MVPLRALLVALTLPSLLFGAAAQAAATRSAQATPRPDPLDAVCVPKVDAKGKQIITRWQRRNCANLAAAEPNVPRRTSFFAVPGLILGAAAAGGGVAAATSSGGSGDDSPGG